MLASQVSKIVFIELIILIEVKVTFVIHNFSVRWKSKVQSLLQAHRHKNTWKHTNWHKISILPYICAILNYLLLNFISFQFLRKKYTKNNGTVHSFYIMYLFRTFTWFIKIKIWHSLLRNFNKFEILLNPYLGVKHLQVIFNFILNCSYVPLNNV